MKPWLCIARGVLCVGAVLGRVRRIPAVTAPARRAGAVIAGALLSQLATPAPAASLLFDHAVYKHPDCLIATLTAAELHHSARPSLSLVALHGGQPTRRLVVPLAERTPGSGAFETAECIGLGAEAKSRGPLLPAAPGDVIVGLARDVRGENLAGALASVAGGTGSGAFRAELDPTLTPPPVGNGVDRAHVATVVNPQGRRAAFIDNQIVVQETRPGLLQAILSRYGARVLNTVRIPGTPRSPTAAPTQRIYHVLEVDPARVPANGLELVVERLGGSDVQGVWRYSSPEAIRLLALVGYEALAGTSVSVNSIVEPSVYPVSNEGLGGNAFAFNWLTPGGPVRAGEALAFAHLLKLGNSVPVAFMDNGFAGPGDYSPSLDNPDYGMPFNSIVQCHSDSNGAINCGPGSASGAAPDPNAPWHGTASFSTAGAALGNAFGAAGIGAEALEPRFYKNEQTLTSLAGAIERALTPPVGLGPPRIINISQGVDCKVLLVDACDPVIQALFGSVACVVFEAAFPELAVLGCAGIAALLLTVENESSLVAAITNAAAHGVVVVASAGNSSEDVNSGLFVPCTIAPTVCVGALDNMPFGAASFSSFGAEVRTWAPGTNLVTTPDPITSPGNQSFSGTSASAPFVSGSLALALAIAPNLTAAGAQNLLFTSNCKSGGTLRLDGTNCSLTGDPKVDTRGYLDVLELVRRARLAAGRPHLAPCTGGFGTDEKSPANDTAVTALALTPLPLMAGQFPYVGDGDHAIHDLTTPPGASDDDWYLIKFASAIADVGFHVNFRLPVPDPTLGSLQLQLWAAEGGLPRPASHVSLNQPSGANGLALLQAILRTDTAYLLQVTTVAPVAQNTNCYSSLQVGVGDRVKVCVPSPLIGGCTP